MSNLTREWQFSVDPTGSWIPWRKFVWKLEYRLHHPGLFGLVDPVYTDWETRATGFASDRERARAKARTEQERFEALRLSTLEMIYNINRKKNP